MKTAEDIAEEIYNVYGTDSGILLGIPASLRSAVTCIIRLTLEKRDVERLGRKSTLCENANDCPDGKDGECFNDKTQNCLK